MIAAKTRVCCSHSFEWKHLHLIAPLQGFPSNMCHTVSWSKDANLFRDHNTTFAVWIFVYRKFSSCFRTSPITRRSESISHIFYNAFCCCFLADVKDYLFLSSLSEQLRRQAKKGLIIMCEVSCTLHRFYLNNNDNMNNNIIPVSAQAIGELCS